MQKKMKDHDATAIKTSTTTKQVMRVKEIIKGKQT